MKLTICNRIITLHIGRTPKGSRCRILPELKVFGRLRHDRASYYLVWMFWYGKLVVLKWDYEKGYDPYNSEIVIEKKVKPTTCGSAINADELIEKLEKSSEYWKAYDHHRKYQDGLDKAKMMVIEMKNGGIKKQVKPTTL